MWLSRENIHVISRVSLIITQMSQRVTYFLYSINHHNHHTTTPPTTTTTRRPMPTMRYNETDRPRTPTAANEPSKSFQIKSNSNSKGENDNNVFLTKSQVHRHVHVPLHVYAIDVTLEVSWRSERNLLINCNRNTGIYETGTGVHVHVQKTRTLQSRILLVTSTPCGTLRFLRDPGERETDWWPILSYKVIAIAQYCWEKLSG